MHNQRLTGSHVAVGVQISNAAVVSHAYKEISGNFEAQEAAGHAWSDLEKVWYDALVETAEAFLGSNNSNGVKDPLIFVAHAFHLVDLEPAAKHITLKVSLRLKKRQESVIQRICAGLSDGSRNGTCK